MVPIPWGLACCGRHPPRVTTVVPTLGSTPSSSHYRGTNRGFSRLHWSAQPTLLSLSWYKPRGSTSSSSRYRGVNPADKIPYRGVNPAHKVPPRVVIVVSNPPRVVIVVSTPPRVVIVVSIQRIRSLIVCYDSTRVAIVGSNPGTAASSSRYRGANPSSSCYRGSNPGFGNIHGVKITGVAIVVQTGGKPTCRNYVSQLEDGPQLAQS